MARVERLPMEEWLTLRSEVLERDNHTCAYCDGRAAAIDHVLPLSRGGTNNPDNLVAACEDCNGRLGSRVFESVQHKREWLTGYTDIRESYQEVKGSAKNSEERKAYRDVKRQWNIENADVLESNRTKKRVCRSCGRLSKYFSLVDGLPHCYKCK